MELYTFPKLQYGTICNVIKMCGNDALRNYTVKKWHWPRSRRTNQEIHERCLRWRSRLMTEPPNWHGMRAVITVPRSGAVSITVLSHELNFSATAHFLWTLPRPPGASQKKLQVANVHVGVRHVICELTTTFGEDCRRVCSLEVVGSRPDTGGGNSESPCKWSGIRRHNCIAIT